MISAKDLAKTLQSADAYLHGCICYSTLIRRPIVEFLYAPSWFIRNQDSVMRPYTERAGGPTASKSLVVVVTRGRPDGDIWFINAIGILARTSRMGRP